MNYHDSTGVGVLCLMIRLLQHQLEFGLSVTLKTGVELLRWLWGGVARWSEHLQLKQRALGSIPGDCLGLSSSS